MERTSARRFPAASHHAIAASGRNTTKKESLLSPPIAAERKRSRRVVRSTGPRQKRRARPRRRHRHGGIERGLRAELEGGPEGAGCEPDRPRPHDPRRRSADLAAREVQHPDREEEGGQRDETKRDRCRAQREGERRGGQPVAGRAPGLGPYLLPGENKRALLDQDIPVEEDLVDVHRLIVADRKRMTGYIANRGGQCGEAARDRDPPEAI